MDSFTKIFQKEKEVDNFDVNISLKGLTFRNILVLKDVFKKYKEYSDDMVKGLSKKQLEQEHYSYRICPVPEVLESIRKAMSEENLSIYIKE